MRRESPALDSPSCCFRVRVNVYEPNRAVEVVCSGERLEALQAHFRVAKLPRVLQEPLNEQSSSTCSSDMRLHIHALDFSEIRGQTLQAADADVAYS